MNIYVTGLGCISSIGNNVSETLQALKEERSGIKPGTRDFSKRFLVGEVEGDNDELRARNEIGMKSSRTALLGMIAAKEAFEGHVLREDVRTGLISGTSVGGMDTSEQLYAKELKGEKYDVNEYRQHPSGTGSEQIAAFLGLNGYINTISTACSSAANAIMLGARMIRSGQLDRVVVGGTDGLSGFTVSGFRSLMIFDDQWCRPFDENRKGLNLGEGAGFIVIESEDSLRKTGSKILAKLSGWSNASDAYHQTASSPDGRGATQAMHGALKVAGLAPEAISYINAHGTATPNNDLSESKAFINVFGKHVPPFSSTKAYTGHTLAASGGIEAVISVLSLQHGLLFPNLNHRDAIQETGLIPVKKLHQVTGLQHVLSNSFGFGGNNSSLIFSQI